jgi:triphosphoribosyl-dephospho-CoA synthase
MRDVETSAGMSVGAAASLACVWEVTAPKPGNVHRGANFEDATYMDFVQSAVVVGPILERTRELGVGRAVLEAVRATREAIGTNTNLGTLLLLAPLAAVPGGTPLAEGIGDALGRLTDDDTRHVYEAIRLSAAGGLGRAAKADVFDDPPANLNLVDAMRLAADRDLVARQYTNQFVDVFAGPSAWIEEGVERKWPLTTAIVQAHLRQLAKEPDSLILRKCGAVIATESRDRAAHVVAAGQPGEVGYERAVAEFDAWLRADGHRRNPGTTADLIAAGLFVLLREGRVELKTITRSHALTTRGQRST